MKIRTLIVSILGVLVVSIASLAQVTEAPEPEPQEPAFMQSDSPTPAQPEPSFVAKTPPTPTPLFRGAPRQNPTPVAPTLGVPPTLPSKSPTEVRLFRLKHADAVELASMIENVFRIPVHPDERLNNILVNARPEQMESIKSLVEATDVAGPEASTSRDVQNLIYRIYMFETPSGNEDMKPFSMSLESTVQVSPQQLLDATAEKGVQISEFRQIDKGALSDILIEGKAASNESLTRMVEKFPDSHIIELKWDDDETFTNNIEAAQYTQLPEQMQKHIGTFLGDDIRTVGYWFGNLSVPGTVEAPIGPWRLNMSLDTESDRMLQLSVDIEAVGELEQIGEETWRQQRDEILSNTIRAKIGKPIIIGYNRKSYGTRKMGAIVIVPEADSLQSDAAATNPNRF